MIKKMILNQKGQAFEAYRVLIAMIISLAVLLIILSSISYFDALRQKVSTDTLYSSWKSAVDSPNGKVIRAGNLSFTQDTRFSRSLFSKQVGLEEDCIQFDSDPNTGYELNDSDPSFPFVRVSQNMVGNIYMQCQITNAYSLPGNPSCYAYCLISFGKEITGVP